MKWTFLLFMLSLPACGGDVFFGQSSSGGSDGSSCANRVALASVTWMAGDTYHVCGTITSQLIPDSSGSSASPITILFESGAKISRPSCGSSGCINLANLAYVIVDGGGNGVIEATNSGTGLASADSVGVYARPGSNYIEVKNLTIRNMYVRSGTTDQPRGSYYAIWFSGRNSSFHNNTIHDVFCGICTEAGSSDSSYYSNTIHDVNWGLFFSGSTTPNSITRMSVHDNEIFDFVKWDDTIGNLFHHDGIFAASQSGTSAGLSYLDIYNNYIHGAISECCTTAYIYINAVNRVRMFNNVVVAPTGDSYYTNNGLIVIGALGVTTDFDNAAYNNVIIGGTTVSHGGPCVRTVEQTRMTFVNNVMSNCTYVMWSAGGSFVTIDYNVYQNPSFADVWRVGSGGYYSTMSAWATAVGGGETHSQATTGSIGLEGGHMPRSDSVLVGRALNLTGLGITPLNSDKAGTQRPSEGSWTAGAYAAAGGTPAAPTGMTATPR